jgi:hypothetical protein
MIWLLKIKWRVILSEDELVEMLEEFETVSDIKEFFENSCREKALKPFDLSMLVHAQKEYKHKKTYTKNINVRNIQGINNPLYNNKTPLYLIHHRQNSDNALKAYINNPEALFEGPNNEKLSFFMVKDKEGNENYFLDSLGNHRVTILLILSDVCEELSIHEAKITELIL